MITIITTLSITIIFYQKSANTIEENYISSNQQRNQQLIENLDRTMKDMYQLLVEVSCDNDIKVLIEEYKKDQTENTLEKIAEILRGYSKRNIALSSFHLIIPDYQVLVTSADYPVYKKVVEIQNIQIVEKEAMRGVGPYLRNSLTGEKTPQLAFVEKIRSKEKNIAYVYANMEERYLYYNYASQVRGEAVTEVLILDKDNQIVTSENTEMIGKSQKLLYKKNKDVKVSEEIGFNNENIYFYNKAPFSQCALYLSVNRSTVLGTLSELRFYYVMIFILILLLGIFLAFYLAKVIYRPIEKLSATVKEVSEGNLETRACADSKDEIGVLSQEFNQMLDHIEELIKQLIEKEKLKKDAELEALQYQVTPHFMYNTLNSIKYAALIKGEEELAELIENFVELLQASISKKGSFISLTEELYILKNYIRLQEFRSNSKISFIYNATKEAENCLVPRLILQPFVENSILHGIDLKEKDGKISVDAYVKEGILYLKVSDNGRGISKEKAKELLVKKVKKTKGFTAIGIPNVRDRLRLYYGAKAGIKYDSDETGTTAVIYLPAEKEEGD